MFTRNKRCLVAHLHILNIWTLVLEWPSSICVLASASWGADAFDPLFCILGVKKKKNATRNMLVEEI